MRNFRFAVVASAFLFCPGLVAAEEASAAREWIGTSFHWEEVDPQDKSLRVPHALVLVSENTAWWISDAIRFRTVSTGEPWRVEGRNKLIWSRLRFQQLEIQIRGSRFSMGWPGAVQPILQGRVSRPKE